MKPSRSEQKKEALRARMQRLGIREEDLEEKFILGAGSGGQKINKSHTCVYLKHKPTGIEVKCQTDRSRERNRHSARHLLCDKIEWQRNLKQRKEAREAAKQRQQKRGRSKKTKEKILEEKRRRGQKKAMRQKPRLD